MENQFKLWSIASVVVHGAVLRERKSFYKKYFAPKKGQLNHHCFWFKLSQFLFIFERGTAYDQIFSHQW